MLPPRDPGSPKPKPRAKKRKIPVAPQAAAYVSQGKAVEKAANAAKPRPVSQVKDTKGAGEFKKANRFKKTKRYQAAVAAAYASRPVPERRARVAQIVSKVFPMAEGARRGPLPEYAPGASRPLNIEDVSVLRTHLARSREDAKQMKQFGFLPRGHATETPRVLPTNITRDKSKQILYETDPKKLKAAGFHAEGFVDKAMRAPAGLIPTAAALAEAAYHDPIGVPAKTAKQLALAAAATPAGVAKLVTHPVETTKEIAKVTADTLTEPYGKKVKRIRKEGGLIDLANLAMVAGPAGRGLAPALSKSLGERAALRVSGGLAVERRANRGITGAVVGKAIDTAKGRRLERLAAKGKPLTGQQRAALLANRAAGRTVEVVPSRVSSRVARDVAKLRGRTSVAQHYDLAKGDYAAVGRTLAKLDKNEKKALWFSAAGIRTADQARELLPTLKKDILAQRGDHAPKGRYARMDAVKRIDEILAAPEKHFTARLDEAMNSILPNIEAISARDPRYAPLTKEARRRADQQALLGLERGVAAEAPVGLAPALRYADESLPEYIARSDARAAEAGLRKPMYFKAERHRGEQADYSAFTTGGGRAMAYEGRFEGRNRKAGILDMSEQAFLRGYARNVKAAHNWPLVEQMVNRHAYNDLTPGSGTRVGPALDAINMAEPELKPGDVALFNPGIFRKQMEKHVDEIKGAEGMPEDFAAQNMIDAMHEASVTPEAATAMLKGVEGAGSYLEKSNGWKAVPTSMLRELEAELKAGTKGGRVLDIAKGKASRAILLSANLPWLGYQIVSEGGVTAIASKGSALNPVNWLGTRKWWKEMSHEQRQEVAAVLGLNSTAGDWKQMRLGAVSSNAFVDGYRAMKENPIWHKRRAGGKLPAISELNPAELMAAADRGKTNITRLLMAHAELKHTAVANMAVNMNRYDKAVTQLMAVFQQPVHQQFDTLMKNPKLLEHVGETLNDWLGDWTTMTASERKVVNRMVMFYPYVRYSTRLMLYTMPTRHPVVTAMLAELGQLTAEEYRGIFGDDDLPWNIGKIYFGKTGASEYIDLARANPLMNAGMGALARIGTNSSNIPGGAIGMMPPYAQWLIDQATARSSYKDRPWRVEGDTSPFPKKSYQIGLETRGRVMLAQMLQLMYPYREAESRLVPGSQGDDSLLWSPRPLNYKKESEIKGGGLSNTIRRLKARNAAANEAFQRENNGGAADLFLGPLVPRPSRDAKSSAERTYVAKLEAEQERRRKQPGRYTEKKPGSPFKKKGGGLFKSGRNSSPFKAN